MFTIWNWLEYKFVRDLPFFIFEGLRLPIIKFLIFWSKFGNHLFVHVRRTWGLKNYGYFLPTGHRNSTPRRTSNFVHLGPRFTFSYLNETICLVKIKYLPTFMVKRTRTLVYLRDIVTTLLCHPAKWIINDHTSIEWILNWLQLWLVMHVWGSHVPRPSLLTPFISVGIMSVV